MANCDIDIARELRTAALLRSVQGALGQLRAVTDTTAVLDRGIRLLSSHVGFNRVIMFRIHGSVARIERALFADDPALGERFRLAAAADPPQLTHMLAETDMLRRREPLLIRDAQHDPRTHKPLIELTDAQGYVAAPIMPAGKVIGFIHADRFGSDLPLDEADRDALAAFADGFGWLFQRAELLDRLQAQRGEIRRLARSAEAVVDEITHGDLQLTDERPGSAIAAVLTAPLPAGADALAAPDDPRRHGTLTQRELEVLALMADGMTNARIADHLVISTTTVKSHVQRVLRKLGAANRAEAVSRYLRTQAKPS